MIIKHLHRDFGCTALSQGRKELLGSPGPEAGGARMGPTPRPACGRARGSQETKRHSSNFPPFLRVSASLPALPGRAHWGLSLRPEKGCQESLREGLAGA